LQRRLSQVFQRFQNSCSRLCVHGKLFMASCSWQQRWIFGFLAHGCFCLADPEIASNTCAGTALHSPQHCSGFAVGRQRVDHRAAAQADHQPG
jgi:hypothetical protein